jgi:hypothetical protein
VGGVLGVWEWQRNITIKNIGDIEVCIDFKMLEVKVPIIFFRHVGFSATQGWTLIYDFIYLEDRDLRPPNHEVVSAQRVFRHPGMDVIIQRFKDAVKVF